MELREIEVFLALADELHFGRTAQRLYLSQARVSQAIRSLESHVGGRLFDRTSRQVRLTPLGESLRDELRPGYEQVLQAISSARARATGVTGVLRISATSTIVVGPAFDQVVRGFEDENPACDVRLTEQMTVHGLELARAGEVDALAAWLPLEQPDLTIGPVLARKGRALVVARDHPLAARGYADAEDLAGLVLGRYQAAPDETEEAMSPSRTPSGAPVKTIPIDVGSTGILAILSNVARGRICHSTVDDFSDYYSHPGVVSIPLHGLPELRSALVWVTARESEAIRAFAGLAATIGAQTDHSG